MYALATKINSNRVQKHLISVLKKLEKADTSSLSELQKLNRQKILGYLREYINLGEYPINDTSFSRHAIFRDKFGNYCAVGYLFHRYGNDSIVDEIEANNNLVYINEITDERYLQAITDMGITVDEAAMIQPTYGFDPYYPEPTSSIDKELIIYTVTIIFYVLFQLSAYMLVTRLDKPRSVKVLMFATLFFGSSLVATAIYTTLQLAPTYWR